MDKYELTTLWQNTLGLKNQTNGYQEQVDFLRQAYYSLRQKAQLFASEINRSLPSFTIHDISHADALWGIASMILSSNENLNPAEGFVLGAAFLIHDLGMGIVAYQEGIEELKKLGREDIVVIAGGVIPAQDYDFLYKAGVAAIFGPGTPVAKAACQILEILMDEE